MTKENIYAWMDKQIIACDIMGNPLDPKNPYYITNAGSTDNRIHVYGIDNLCKELGRPYQEEPYSKEYDCHYLMYKEHKFFGLIDKVMEENL